MISYKFIIFLKSSSGAQISHGDLLDATPKRAAKMMKGENFLLLKYPKTKMKFDKLSPTRFHKSKKTKTHRKDKKREREYFLPYYVVHTPVENSDGCWAGVGFYVNCKGTTAIFGHPGLDVLYTITPINTAQTLVCCNVRGFNGTQAIWFTIGCGYSTFYGSVPWGNILAVKQAQCKGIPFGTFYYLN